MKVKPTIISNNKTKFLDSFFQCPKSTAVVVFTIPTDTGVSESWYCCENDEFVHIPDLSMSVAHMLIWKREDDTDLIAAMKTIIEHQKQNKTILAELKEKFEENQIIYQGIYLRQ